LTARFRPKPLKYLGFSVAGNEKDARTGKHSQSMFEVTSPR